MGQYFIGGKLPIRCKIVPYLLDHGTFNEEMRIADQSTTIGTLYIFGTDIEPA